MENNPAQKEGSFLMEMQPYLAGNDLRRALDLAQKRLSEIPEDLDARMVICRAWLMQGREDEALGMIAEIEERLFGLADLYAAFGDLFAKKGFEGKADIFYRKLAALRLSVFPGEIAPEKEELAAGHEKEELDESDEESSISAEFETATLAELYMRQGHVGQAAAMLEKIVAREPSNDRARLLLQRVRTLVSAGEEEQKNAAMVATLERWLENVERLRCHAG